jgi:oligopeptide transport system substrate-binding protein
MPPRSIARLLLALPAAAALLAGPGCARRETPAESARRSGILLLGNGAEPQDLDPQTSVAFTDFNVLLALFEGLTCMDEQTSQAVPGVAERWEVSADGLTYTFHLRADARWSNGDPLTAGDFVFSFHRVLSPALASEYSYLFNPIRNAEAFAAGRLADFAAVGVSAPDAHTLRLELARPCPYLPALAALPCWFPVHRATIERFGPADRRGTAWTRPGNLVGNGPFTLREWNPNDRIVVARNPRYWDDSRTTLNGVVFFPDESIATDEANFRAGQEHLTNDLLPDRIAHYRATAPDTLRIDPLSQTYFLRFNVTRPPLNDPRVRQALARAIDRAAIARDVLQDSRLPAYALTPPHTAGYTPAARLPTDFAGARQLLAAAGYPGGRNFPRLDVLMFTDAINTKVLEAIQQMWHRELGIDVGLVNEDLRVYLDAEKTLAYQVSLSRWYADYNDPSTYLDLFKSDCPNNWTGWADPAYDRANDRADRELDPAARRALLQQAEARLLAAGPIAPIFYGSRTYLIQPYVRGWPPALLGNHRYQHVQLDH